MFLAGEIEGLSVTLSTGETFPSSVSGFGLSSGEPAPELGGEVFGVPRSQPFADHAVGLVALGLSVDAIDWELGKDLRRRPWPGGKPATGCCEWRELSMALP